MGHVFLENTALGKKATGPKEESIRRPEKIKKALENFEDKDSRWKCVEDAGEVKNIKVREHELYIQLKGIELSDAREIVEMSCTRSHLPEPIRVAHLIAAGVTEGESRGRA